MEGALMQRVIQGCFESGAQWRAKHAGTCTPEQAQAGGGQLRLLLPVVVELDAAAAHEKAQHPVEHVEHLRVPKVPLSSSRVLAQAGKPMINTPTYMPISTVRIAPVSKLELRSRSQSRRGEP